MAILRLYRLADQITHDGLHFLETEVASQSSLSMPAAIEEFQNACAELRDQMRDYLK